jgi:predicted ester cyclase
MDIDENKQVARTWFERVMNGRDIGAIDEAYSDDYVHRGPDGHEFDRAAAKAIAEHLIAAVPDRIARVVDQIAEGDRVVTRWESRGTQTGMLFGREPTGEEIIGQGVVVSRVVDGRIVDDWEITHLG